MRKPNGFGGIVKNGGARRKPYQLRKTIRVYRSTESNYTKQ